MSRAILKQFISEAGEEDLRGPRNGEKSGPKESRPRKTYHQLIEAERDKILLRSKPIAKRKKEVAKQAPKHSEGNTVTSKKIKGLQRRKENILAQNLKLLTERSQHEVFNGELNEKLLNALSKR
eukprot:TRINITY_DN754_c1_g1_i1.p1 TRINITY_DN754_c1_g1~~TRINITY_DN754_c1_g1_i1.p1  ORF type:complete len:124 (+),score=30.47 TRINITY_DN754_c1_g1_i1:37-408(+)